MLGVVRDAIGGGFAQSTSREHISLLELDKCFHRSNSITWTRARR